MRSLLSVTAALCCLVAACRADSADEMELVRHLRSSVPFGEDEVVPAGNEYERMARSAAAALASERVRRQMRQHEEKWLRAGGVATPVTGSSFDCVPERSHRPPASVHRLRPADIDVIASIGDSLTAGMGIHSRTIATIFTQYRGHSFTMGGKEDLSKHTTLPTILKKFNTRLVGYSTGISGPDGRLAGFNEAVVGNRAEDMPRQARQVVEKMKNSKEVRFGTDWKLINLFIGGNDVCDFCKDRERFSADNYERHVRAALEYFYENVPRALVNLVEVMDISAVSSLKDQSIVCRALLKSFWCRCGATLPKSEIYDFSRQLQLRLRKIAEDPKWTSKRDFTVVLQPFMRNLKPPLLPNGRPDLSYFAPDCFHLSARGHAMGGVSLWNNMLQPVGRKRTDWIIGDTVNCPTKAAPFLATKMNSGGDS